jgi:hypothetical protein
VLKLRIA